ncbi:50S ribosome-binding GTPase, partial [Patescibacteria group bacterium]|nr:50S ribosome-binding GTPase [Patescibacteria group bacterium]
MLLSCGIVGLPNVGKSTLFNALLSRQIADTSPYPFCTIEPNVGIVEIPDTRIKQIAEAENSKITAPAIIKFVDIAGLVKNAHQGEGLGNQFLAHIREVETIIHVIRLFKNDLVTTLGDAGPTEDYKTIQTELILADLGTLDKQKEPKGELTKELKLWWQTIISAKEILNRGIALNNSELTAGQKELLNPLCLLTIKPELKVLNINESQYDNLENIHKDLSHLDAVAVCAKLESELIDLDQSERGEY